MVKIISISRSYLYICMILHVYRGVNLFSFKNNNINNTAQIITIELLSNTDDLETDACDLILISYFIMMHKERQSAFPLH